MDAKKESPVLASILLILAVTDFLLYKDMPEKKELPAMYNYAYTYEPPAPRELTPEERALSLEIEKGDKLFRRNCAVCHSMGGNMITGPGLKGIMNRVPSEKWLEGYISNNDSVFKSGDAYAAKLHALFPCRMTTFTHLSKEEIKAIVSYMRNYHEIVYTTAIAVP